MPSEHRGTLRTHVREITHAPVPTGGPMVELNLTKRQQEIFEFVKRYVGDHGYPPTVRDIGKAIGLTSSSTVHAHLANLEKLGLLKRDPTKPRAIEVLVDKAKSLVQPSRSPPGGAIPPGRARWRCGGTRPRASGSRRAGRSWARSPPARPSSPRRTS